MENIYIYSFILTYKTTNYIKIYHNKIINSQTKNTFFKDIYKFF